MTKTVWQQGELIEVAIADLSDTGDGVGRYDQRAVFIPDTVPGDRAIVRLVHVKPKYAHARLQQLLQPSPHRIRPSCIVADKCGGCQWQHINYEYQLVPSEPSYPSFRTHWWFCPTASRSGIGCCLCLWAIAIKPPIL